MELSRAKAALVRRLHDARSRARERCVLAEGPRVIAEAVAAGHVPRFLVRRTGGTDEVRESELMAAGDAPVHEVTDSEFRALAGTETPQGLLAVFEEPVAPSGAPLGRRVLVLDAVQDPGNVGTLIRSARAFGVDAVWALDGTCDPWAPKVVRAAAGCGFHLPIHRGGWPAAEAALRTEGLPLLVATAEGERVDGVRVPGRWALAVGNEGGGVREEVLAAADCRIAVPMSGGVDSLNAGVAGSILLYALTRGDVGAPDRGSDAEAVG